MECIRKEVSLNGKMPVGKKPKQESGSVFLTQAPGHGEKKTGAVHGPPKRPASEGGPVAREKKRLKQVF